jgi:hypothetical protein
MTFMAPFAPAFAGASILSNLADGFMGAEGTRQAGQASSLASYYQAQVAKNEAALNEMQAQRELAAGSVESQAVGLKSAANLGSIKAGQAAAGIDVNTGSAVDVQSSARMVDKLAQEQTMNNAFERAWGYRIKSQNDEAEAQLDVMAGNNEVQAADTAATAQEIGALGTGLMGTAQALGAKWAT